MSRKRYPKTTRCPNGHTATLQHGTVKDPDARVQGDPRRGLKRGITIPGQYRVTYFYACSCCEWCEEAADVIA